MSDTSHESIMKINIFVGLKLLCNMKISEVMPYF